MNAQKEAMNFKRSFQPVGGSGGVPSQQEKEAAAADAGFAILEKRMQPERKVDQKLMPPPPMVRMQNGWKLSVTLWIWLTRALLSAAVRTECN